MRVRHSMLLAMASHRLGAASLTQTCSEYYASSTAAAPKASAWCNEVCHSSRGSETEGSLIITDPSTIRELTGHLTARLTMARRSPSSRGVHRTQPALLIGVTARLPSSRMVNRTRQLCIRRRTYLPQSSTTVSSTPLFTNPTRPKQPNPPHTTP